MTTPHPAPPGPAWPRPAAPVPAAASLPAVTDFVHVTRLPPSPSGVAAYADIFSRALALLAPTRPLRLPADPSASQSLPRALRLARRLRPAARRPGTVLVVEVAGRGVAEFWAAWWSARRGARVWLMVHDVPELSGGAFFTRLLDRRGGRRLAAALSATWGRRAEHDLLHRAERVLTLSPSGAAALAAAHHLTRPVEHVPHVAADPGPGIPVTDRHEVLVPGYVHAPEDVAPLLRALPSLPRRWHLTVGACPPAVTSALTLLAAALGVTDRVHLLGFTDEPTVRAAFARAAVVVRWRRAGWSAGSARYAVSGPLVAALAHGCAVLTDDDRGTAYLYPRAGAQTVGPGEQGEHELLAALDHLLHAPDDLARRSQAARGQILAEHTPAAVAAVLAAPLAPPTPRPDADARAPEPAGSGPAAPRRAAAGPDRHP